MIALFPSRWTSFVGIAVIFAPSMALATPPSFPMNYRGVWSLAAEDCAHAKAAIRISDNSIDYFDEYRMRGLQQVVRQNARGMTVLAKYAAEGHEWTERVDFKLAPGRRLLTITRASVQGESSSETMRYQRCSASKTSR